MNIKPNPEDYKNSILQQLKRPKYIINVAEQAREMGIKVGDVIVGREGGDDWWQEQRLKLVYLGKKCCVWETEWRSNQEPNFRPAIEECSWDLSCRDWYKIIEKL